ncbi:cyclin-dependent kinase inhibitor 1 [Diretmus argenteus]
MATHKLILSTQRSGPTRRNLFGPVDREQLQAEYRAALRKDLEDASRRWGFDFVSEKPLEGGDFQWEGVPAIKVPLLYRSCMLELGQIEGQRAAGATVDPWGARARPSLSDKENIPHTLERCALDLDDWEKTPEKGQNTSLKRKQTNITDFYQAKRRVVFMPRKSGQRF